LDALIVHDVYQQIGSEFVSPLQVQERNSALLPSESLRLTAETKLI
jgi:hypothetical protein